MHSGAGGAAGKEEEEVVAFTPALRLKVLSCGDSGVGKSCLIKRYCEGKFVSKYVTTIGVDYGVRPVVVAGRECRVNFFDLSGADVYADIRNEFYKEAQAVMLVFSVDNRPSFDRLDGWWREAASCKVGTPVWVLVGNKIDGGKRAVTTEEATKWAVAHKMRYYETSANTGEGVGPMFEHLFADGVGHVVATTTTTPAKAGDGT